jgi:hypothetical protein
MWQAHRSRANALHRNTTYQYICRTSNFLEQDKAFTTIKFIGRYSRVSNLKPLLEASRPQNSYFTHFHLIIQSRFVLAYTLQPLHIASL